ncbi:MAG: sulfatase-like hydrolase/transferase [Gammaproteobacteria bacterium]|nr:sulfatase-like hydrolase/transferase [Gammaproteobacteria bacterium]
MAQIFTQLEQQEILQNSIVYILSDHGEGLGEHGHYGHTRFLYEEHTRIPLFIYDPLGNEYLNTQYATHIDIALTILESLGLETVTEMGSDSKELDNLIDTTLGQEIVTRYAGIVVSE